MINDQTISQIAIGEILEKGSNKIAPLWSLENFVAVNPYLGMSDMKFGDAMDFLNRCGKIKGTLPVAFYIKALSNGQMKKEDISLALQNNPYHLTKDVDLFLSKLLKSEELEVDKQVRNFVDVASGINGKKWVRFMIDRISFWASAYFDDKQAVWDTASNKASLFSAWKREAEVDFAPEAMGLKGFRKLIKQLPDDYEEAASIALNSLNLSDHITEYYLNTLLMKMNGWAGFTARIDWEARLEGQESHVLQEFLSIMLVWELCLKELLTYEDLDWAWLQAKQLTESSIQNQHVENELATKLVLQQAFDIANQRKIIEKINSQENADKPIDKKVKAQAVFCIDVRSELYRRNLEKVDNEIETMGFAGFFAFPIKYIPLAHQGGMSQCPVLLTPTHSVKEEVADADLEKQIVDLRLRQARLKKVWKSFKQSAISCFSFVSPLGIYFLPKLLTDALGITRPVSNQDKIGLTDEQYTHRGVRLDQENWQKELIGIPLEDRIKMASSALKAMSFHKNFAPVVLLVGHGANTVNNPHATGLDCGACGGHSGEANAKVASGVLNDPEVREALKGTDSEIPERTVFIPALHDTTTDNVSMFYNARRLSAEQAQTVQELKYAMKLAGEGARKERGERMNVVDGDISKKVLSRSKDWSQVRPEWGLAGCSSFIVAPRERTAQLNFGGRAFMHNYSWKNDEGFGVLELIMTAPMVVTSWINLQYYASTVDNKRFGSGNKALHNVVGGMGVLEGFAGDLRTGLPWQSVHDGNIYQHEPQRLNVIIEAPVDEMSKILEKHESIRQLCDNEWIYLFAMSDHGKVKYKYIGNLQWEVVH